MTGTVRALCLTWGAVVALLAYPAGAQFLGDQRAILGGEGFYRPLGVTASVTLAAPAYTRTVTASSYTLTGTSTGSGAVTWAASPSGSSGACTGTDTFSCVVTVTPDAVGEGVETITVTRGAATDTETLGFYVAGAHTTFLSQNVNGAYNVGLADLDAVSTWENVGTSALDVTQPGAATLKPTFRTGIVGGQPVVRCDGGDRVAASTASDWTYLSDGTGSTVEAVQLTASTPSVQVTSATSRLVLSTHTGYGQAINTTFRAQFYLSNGVVNVINLAGSNNTTSTSKFDMHTSTVATANTPDFTTYINGTSVISSTPASYSAGAPDRPLTICAAGDGGFALTGDLFRVITYQSALDSTQRGINKAVDEWALGGTLPVTP